MFDSANSSVAVSGDSSGMNDLTFLVESKRINTESITWGIQEGPVRPVLECIDLRSDSEDEVCSSSEGTVIHLKTRIKTPFYLIGSLKSLCLSFSYSWKMISPAIKHMLHLHSTG